LLPFGLDPSVFSSDVKKIKIRIYKTIISPVVLYGCETLSLALREEHRLRVFENRVLRRIFGPKRDEVMEEWRKFYNEELRDFYSSPSIIRIMKSRRMRWTGHLARMREKRNAYRLLVGKPEGKRPLGRQDVGAWIMLGWISVGGMERFGLDWSGSGQEQVESLCEFGSEPWGSMKCWETILWPNI
jgi:hypothetical protein